MSIWSPVIEEITNDAALTDAELRATPVPISGTVTATPSGTQDVNVTNASVAVTGPLTDTELRATAVPVDGSGVTQPISAASLPLPTGAATESTVAGLLTDTQLRASPVPVTSGTVASATITRIGVSTNTTLAAANVSRQKLIIVTESGTTYIKLGAVASSISYTYLAGKHTHIEITGYTGQVDAIASAGTNQVQVTEL